ncbi:MAG: 23S rRNA (pseudouridine(1915)-N(3))-methyltransferase RlmH, partial [Chitinophagales bacterium]|nr:23S rRNA (pseudouridine(1915)-N(3))-methyltransferase RlmH [Chitinophagales bacterium]
LLMKKMNSGTKGLCFVVGGAYGFHKSIYDKSSLMISLSKMTLPHQLAKIVFIEQLYRSFTIIKNEKYHH